METIKKYIILYKQFKKFINKYHETAEGLYYKLGDNRYIKISL